MSAEQVIKSLEDVIAKSPLSKMWVVNGYDGSVVVSTYLFAMRGDMEKAKRLKTALANDAIESEQYENEFPDVLHMAVEVLYESAEVRTVGEGARLSLPQDAVLPDMSMLLCLGLRYSYVPDDDKCSGEVLFRVNFSEDGTVSNVQNTNLVEPPLVQVRATALEAFKALESYLIPAATD